MQIVTLLRSRKSTRRPRKGRESSHSQLPRKRKPQRNESLRSSAKAEKKAGALAKAKTQAAKEARK
jgi:hypothetical protein